MTSLMETVSNPRMEVDMSMRNALPPSQVWMGSDRQFSKAAKASWSPTSPMNTCEATYHERSHV